MSQPQPEAADTAATLCYQDLVIANADEAGVWLAEAAAWQQATPNEPLTIEVFAPDAAGQSSALAFARQCDLARDDRNTSGQPYHKVFGIETANPEEAVAFAFIVGQVVM